MSCLVANFIGNLSTNCYHSKGKAILQYKADNNFVLIINRLPVEFVWIKAYYSEWFFIAKRHNFTEFRKIYGIP